ncbi:DNA cytosine methyltransferase [Amycolatopsis sp. H20-H5]|uniref:DNA cytosine methyltransferase n=1 Tax=Amycolatopsis sp. H20-H5 TaxID=3046309 RepID=UPI002DB97887|nr:DNA cytosine methyltransferase [Amycolatopsis sp. H20-H5]MEC3979893.1 DNA cytosine methyltransferase [Amycolatopsis sp. H20-H5]
MATSRTPAAAPGVLLRELRFVATPGPVIGSLCTGVAGLDLGVASVLGGRIAWYAETDPHASAILAARLPGVPNLGDLMAVDFAAVERVEVLTAGFPCQDISAAGRRAGIEKGERIGLWSDVLDSVRVLRPDLLVVENVAALRWKNGGLHRVLGGLAEAGYDAVWRCVRASDIGAAHRRERVFVCAVPQPGQGADDADAAGPRRRTPRPRRPGTPPGGRAPGQPQRRRRLGDQTPVVTAGVGHWDTRPPRRGRVPADAVATGPATRRTRRPAAVADTDVGGLAIGGDPDRAQPGPPDPRRVRDADRLGPAAADTDGAGREELHPHHPRGRTVITRRSPHPQTENDAADTSGSRTVLRDNTISGGGGAS